jgi:hypothetical protein
MAGQQQLIDHVEHQQRLHAVEGNAVPQLGAGDGEDSARMAEHGSLPGERGSLAGNGCHALSPAGALSLGCHIPAAQARQA